jgi:hypothetical protein
MVRAKDLVSEGVGAAWRRVSGDRAGAHDLPFADSRIKAGKPVTPAAGKAHGAITLAVGNRRRHSSSRVIGSGASVDGGRTPLLHASWKAEGADHVTVAKTLPVDVANISVVPRGGGVTELEADAVAFEDIALAIRDLVVNEAASGGAKRVPLFLANRERWRSVERRCIGSEC